MYRNAVENLLMDLKLQDLVLVLLLNAFLLCVCVFHSSFPLRRCVSGPPSLDLQPREMERHGHTAFSAASLRDYSWEFSESLEEPVRPYTSSEQISMYVGSQDNAET